MAKSTLLFFLMFFTSSCSFAQVGSLGTKKLQFTGDFRFRIEHDWSSRKSDGNLREDRSRLRYRFRFGLNYSIDKYSSFGARIRSGNINDQQGPHVTIGGNDGEFGLVQVGFEKLFYQYKAKQISGWIGKNSIPIKKLNELFWNDNVFVEGVGVKLNLLKDSHEFLNQLAINAGHFIINSNGQTFSKDSYLQVAQVDLSFFKNKLNLFPSFYHFKNIGNFPDRKKTFTLDYSIFHLGSEIKIFSNLKLGLEFYNNLADYDNHDLIISEFKDQKKGIVVSAKYGRLKRKGDFQLNLYYAYLQKYAIVDVFAQNDWVRWDYSSIGATGSRISNFQGIEIRAGYAFKEKFNLILRTYFVEQLVRIGNFKETGNRIRLDLNIGF